MRGTRPDPGRDVGPLSLNVVGLLTSAIGLGVAARNTVRLLRPEGMPLHLSDVNTGGGRQGRDTSVTSTGSRDADSQPAPITLFHLNPLEALEWLTSLGKQALADRVRAIVPFWELEEIPEDWVEVLAAVDVILAPTSFVADSIRRSVPDCVIVDFPQSVVVPGGIVANRASWGLPEGPLLFLSIFDAGSDSGRKNPMGAVAAFQRAFPDRDDVLLAFKISSMPGDVSVDPPLAALVEAAQGDPRIRIMTHAASYAEVLQLHAAADVYLSLHRSEGLGLTMMEAMSLGVPVVATAYSGNLDFMNADNSILIPYSMIPMEARHHAYASLHGRVRWADPDLEAAASALRDLADDAGLRGRLAETAKQDMAARSASVQSGQFVAELQAVLRSERVRAGHPQRARAFRKLMRWIKLRRIIGIWRHRAAVGMKLALGRVRAGR